jgi:nucleotide-binding universal stress UspA family protein
MDNAQIVVGVDGSHAAQQALLWAAAEAQRRGVLLVIAYAGDAEPMPGSDSEQPRLTGHSVLANSTALVFDRGIDCDIRTVSRHEPAVTLLLDLDKQADLVVVGTHGSASDTGASLGSVAYRVAAHATSPVAVIGHHPWTPPDTTGAGTGSIERRPISVGVTASPNGQPALELAFAEAALRDRPLNAVHSWAEFDWAEAAGTGLYLGVNDFRRHQQDRLALLLAPLRERHPEVTVRLTLIDAPVWVGLVEASDESSLLVLGCRYRGNRLVSRLGTTTTRLIHVARCPVIVVGHPAVPTAELPSLVSSGTEHGPWSRAVGPSASSRWPTTEDTGV